MRTSAHGNCEQGFTLIELLVVLVIIGIAVGMVGLSTAAAPDRQLREDAERLRDAFEVAQSEARSDGRPITWSANASGWHFQRAARPPASSTGTAPDDAPLPPDTFEQDSVLHPYTWRTPPVSVDPSGTAGRQVFGTEWVADPMSIHLSAGGQAVTLTRDAAGDYDIR
jgi:general secretion pathway protein H